MLHASGLAHIPPGLLSLHAVKRAVENLQRGVMPKICAGFFLLLLVCFCLVLSDGHLIAAL